MSLPLSARTRALGIGLAVATVALAACKGGGSSPSPVGSATPTATISPTTATASGTPIPASIGVAYLPDGGRSSGFTGLQIVHFEDVLGHLLPNTTTSTPQPVTFAGAVGPFAISIDGATALAAVSRSASPPYTLVESVYGTSSSATVPVGTGYDVTQNPTAAPNVSPSPGFTPTPVPSPATLSAVTSVSIYGSAAGGQGVGVIGGPDTSGFLGLTQLTNAGPTFGGFVPFAGQTATPTPQVAARPHIVTLTTSNGSLALARGPVDLLTYTIAVGGNGYTFTNGTTDTTLGLTGTALGPGVMAIDPADPSRALVGQTNPGDGSTRGVTLVTNLPKSTTHASTIDVGSTPRSIAITNGGAFAVVGTDQGFVVVNGVDGTELALNNSFAPAQASSAVNHPTYTGCDGKSYSLANVGSVAFSADGVYLAVLGNAPSAACAGGRTASLVVVPFDETTGTTPTAGPSPAASTTPAPTIFVQNNIIAPATGQDYLFVR